MIGDVLYIKDEHRECASELFKMIERLRNSQRFVVAISGESGSGKSVLSHCLATEYKNIGKRAKILHTDNYYKILPELRNDWRQKHGADSIGYEEYDWDILNSNIAAFRKGTQTEMPCVDLLTDQVDSLTTDFSTIEILILDGLYAIKCADVDMRVFIDITYHETKKAQIIRGKEKLTSFREMILQREHEMVSALRDCADVVVDTTWEIANCP